MPQKIDVRDAAPVKNPAAGTTLTVMAGAKLSAEFEFVNDSPDVAVFDIVVEGLPAPNWLDVDSGRYSATAAASGTGTLLIVLAPPANAAVGEYPIGVSVASGGSTIGLGRIPLVLRVEPAPTAATTRTTTRDLSPPLPEADGATAEITTTTASADAAPTTAKPKRPAAPRPRPEPQAGTDVPELVLRPGSRPVTEPKPEPAAAQAEPASAAAETSPEPIPQPATAQPIMPVQPIAPAPQPVHYDDEVEDLPVVDYSRPPEEDSVEEEPERGEPVIAERSLLDPAEGTIFSLCPGETLLVRFSFINDSPAERTYILDEDRSLESGWITLVQDQVNLTRNGRGEVSFRLTPPKNAEPGEYPFHITAGLQGGVLSSIPLTLAVQAMPAVKLTAKQSVVSIGPLSTSADVGLIVESAGNADTAFRIGVKNPEATKDAGDGHKPDIIYESGKWRYLFDREMEDLRAPSFGRSPQPVPIRLRLVRHGIWGFGFTESHTVRVAAVPVTEPANNGKPGNTVDVTVRRWRFLPFPLALLVPVALILLWFFSQGASEFAVQNTYRDPTGQYWVVTPPGDHKSVTLSWTAPAWTLLHLTGKVGDQQTLSTTLRGSGSETETVPVSSQDRRTTAMYRLSRLVAGGGREATVSFIYTSPDTPLLYTDATTHTALPGSTITLSVPPTGYARLDLTNSSRQFYRIDWWMADTLQTNGPFRFLYNKDSGSIEPGASEHFLISRNPGAQENATDQIVFVTTDASRPIVTVNVVNQ